MTTIKSLNWPSLPEKGFVSGRAATKSDLATGDAVFFIDPAGSPIPIDIPQYALFKNEVGERLPVFVLQAEVGDVAMVGLRGFDGKYHIARLDELELLGKTPGATPRRAAMSAGRANAGLSRRRRNRGPHQHR